jgi:hypothetical protein
MGAHTVFHVVLLGIELGIELEEPQNILGFLMEYSHCRETATAPSLENGDRPLSGLEKRRTAYFKLFLYFNLGPVKK